MRLLPCLLLITLTACTTSSIDRCLAECDRSAANPECAPDRCRALCQDPAVASCTTQLDALLNCSALVPADMLCGGTELVCSTQNASLGSCISAARADAGLGGG